MNGIAWLKSAALLLTLTASSVGCMSISPTRTASPRDSQRLGQGKKHDQPTVAPDFSKTFAGSNKSTTSHGVPATNASQPGGFQKVTQAVTDSAIVQGITAGFKKTTSSAAELFSSKPTGKPPRASSLATKAEPSASLYVSFARVQESRGDLNAAEAQYRKALGLDRKDVDALLGYARVLDRQGKTDQALKQYQDALRYHPKDPSVHNDLGLFHGRHGRYDDAARSLAKAVELKPDRNLYRNNIAAVLVELGRTDEAYAHLSAVHPAAVAHYNIGFLLGKKGDKHGSLVHMDRALAADPQLAEAREYRQTLLAELPQSQRPQYDGRAVAPPAGRSFQYVPPRSHPSAPPAAAPMPGQIENGPSFPAAQAARPGHYFPPSRF